MSHTDNKSHEQSTKARNRDDIASACATLRENPMMAHLLDALESGEDIGHYGRLTFVMVARFFLPDEELARLLAKQPGHDESDMRTLITQARERDYNPPRPERIHEWQTRQDFPICPDPEDPRACNVYRDLQFPEGLYDRLQEFQEEQTAEHETA